MARDDDGNRIATDCAADGLGGHFGFMEFASDLFSNCAVSRERTIRNRGEDAPNRKLELATTRVERKTMRVRIFSTKVSIEPRFSLSENGSFLSIDATEL